MIIIQLYGLSLMKSTTNIPTHEAHRIAKRLLNHWKHKFEVNESQDQQEHTIFSIFMPEATVKLNAFTDVLKVDIITEREDYMMLESVVIDHLNRMAQQQFDVEWQHSNENI